MAEAPHAPPRRARLELLVRREDEADGFELRQIGSGIAFVRSRPQRVAAGSFELAEVASKVDGQHSFILKNTATDRFLLLSGPERFLWEQMDGRTSLQDIATAYVLRYGEFDFAIIPHLIRKLQRAQLLTMTSTSRLRQALARNRRQPVAKVAESALFALARLRYGRRGRKFGFTFLHGFVPTFYVDVTDIFMGSRKARVVTAVSGALVHLVLGSVWLLVAVNASMGSFLQAFAAASGIIQWQAFVVALYPFCFIEMDGYHVLVDVLGIPTLKHDAIGYVAGLLRGRRPRPFTRETALFVGYVVVSTLSVAAFIAFNVWLIVHAS